MENVFLKERENYSSFYMFLFLFFNLKKIIKKEIKKGEYFDVYYIPSLKKLSKKNKEKFIKRMVKFLKSESIKNICCGKINEDLKETLEKEFEKITGEETFFENIDMILDFFAKKKGINLSNNEVCFISNNPDVVKKLILKCKNKVKTFSVLTDNKEIFNNLKERISEELGIFIKINEKKKKINTVYINCENKVIKLKEYLVKANTIDIFKIYKNTYFNVKIFYKTYCDKFLDENNIEKNIIFTDFFKECIKKSPENIKIVNIKKYD